eukprot:514486-Amphidinium_carterae.1
MTAYVLAELDFQMKLTEDRGDRLAYQLPDDRSLLKKYYVCTIAMNISRYKLRNILRDVN